MIIAASDDEFGEYDDDVLIGLETFFEGGTPGEGGESEPPDDGAPAPQEQGPSSPQCNEEEEEEKKETTGASKTAGRSREAPHENPFLARIHSLAVNCTVRFRYSKSAAEAVLGSLWSPNLGPPALTDEAQQYLPKSRKHLRDYIKSATHRTKNGILQFFTKYRETALLDPRHGSFVKKLPISSTEHFPIVLRRHGQRHRTISVSYLPVERWVQSLMLTPAYATSVKTLADICRTHYQIFIIGHAEKRKPRFF